MAAACKDDCTTKLSKRGISWFETLGSKELKNLEYRCGFAFIGVVGGTNPIEKISENPASLASATQIFQVNEEEPEGGEKADEKADAGSDKSMKSGSRSLSKSGGGGSRSASRSTKG